jgi:hypothetical protein
MIRFFAVIIHVFILSLCLSKGWAKNVHNSSVLKPLQASLLTPIAKPALLVVHASTEFDKNMVAKQGIDKLIKTFKSKKLPVIYLVSDLSETGQARWYTDDRNPDFVIYSTAGEHNLPLSNADITVVGGFWGSRDGARGCHSLALRNVIQSYFFWQHKQTPLRLHLPLSAIYFFNSDEVLKKTTLKDINKPKLWSEDLLKSLLIQTAVRLFSSLANLLRSARFVMSPSPSTNPCNRARSEAYLVKKSESSLPIIPSIIKRDAIVINPTS